MIGDKVFEKLDRRGFMRLSTAAVAAAAGGRILEGGAALATANKPWKPTSNLAYLGVYEWQTPFIVGISQPEGLEAEINSTSPPKFTINHCFRLVDETPQTYTPRTATDNNDEGTRWPPLSDRFTTYDIPPGGGAGGRIPMLSWAAGAADDSMAARVARLVEIANGDRDVFIDGQAIALKNLNAPVFLRFTWEFDLDSRYQGHYTEFKAAWIHVYNRFQAAGATNVAFVWCPSRNAFNNNNAADADKFWPGGAYVDWIGCDGYSRIPRPDPDHPTAPLPPVETFFSLFAAAHVYSQRSDRNKPFMVCETGVERDDADHPGFQANFLTGLLQNLDDGRFANMKALTFFFYKDSWRLDQPTSGAAWTKFKQLANHPRMIMN